MDKEEFVGHIAQGEHVIQNNLGGYARQINLNGGDYYDNVPKSGLQLPIAEDAAFGSAIDQHEPKCLSGTRVDVLGDILKWVGSPQETCLYWLNGKAGTGKSTISRTICKQLESENLLGASFFFKRGEGNRGNAVRLFTTLAYRLAVHSPAIKSSIKDALDADPSIPTMAFTAQFNKLILQPLSNSKSVSPKIVIVIDALDECEGESDIKAIVAVLAQAREAKPVDLRILLTSRPELPVLLGFGEVSGRFQDCILHKVPSNDSDILFYLRDQLSKIREQAEKHRGCSFPENWPDEEKFQKLVSAAIPLFIAAATYCRFIVDKRSHPDDRLEIVCRDNGQQFEQLDETYITVLKQLVNQDDSEDTQDHDARDDSDGLSGGKRLASDFRQIVGTIIILATPLSIPSIARLLSMEETTIRLTLSPLDSVLNIPEKDDRDGLVRTFHLSFPDFLLGPSLKKKRKLRQFWIDKKKAHGEIASKCTDLMSKELKANICRLRSHGTLRSEIKNDLVDQHIPAELRYACRYWTGHLVRSGECIVSGSRLRIFLQEHLLHWLEVMSLLGGMFEVIHAILGLQSRVDGKNEDGLIEFLYDIKRFVLQNQVLIDKAPLQVYSSAILFLPELSIVRTLFKPMWVQKYPESKTEETFASSTWSWIPKSIGTKSIFKRKSKKTSRGQGNWSALLQTFEGHSDIVYAVAFSPDGNTIASGSGDRTVKLWDVTTGRLRQTFEGHNRSVHTVAFSPDGNTIASGSKDETIKLWDVTTNRLRQTFEGHSDILYAVAFSPDGNTIASGSWDRTVKLWDVTTGQLRQTFKGHGRSVHSVSPGPVAFSPDGNTIASGSGDQTVKLWDVTTGRLRQTFEGHSDILYAVAFSPDGNIIASGSWDQTVKLWDVTTGQLRQTFEGHGDILHAVAFSPDGKTIASGSKDETVKLWDVTTLQQTAVAFSPDGSTIVSGSKGKTIKLWDVTTRRLRQTAVAFSPDCSIIASSSRGKTIKLWDVTTGRLRQTFEGHSFWVKVVAFSPDGNTIASGSEDQTVKLWDVTTGRLRQTFEGHNRSVHTVAFSPDGNTIASGSKDETVKLWDVTTGRLRQTFEGHGFWVTAVAFSSDNNTIASGSKDGIIKLWGVTTGRLRQTFEGHGFWVTAVAFSPDGNTIASGSEGKTIELWDVTTGQLQRTFNTKSFTSQLVWCHGGYITNGQESFSYDQRSNSQQILQPSHRAPVSIRVHDQWLMRGEENLFWLPDSYRPRTSAVHGTTVVLGSSSGSVTIINFDFSSQTLV